MGFVLNLIPPWIVTNLLLLFYLFFFLEMEAKQAWLFVQCVLIVFDGVLLVVSGSCTTSCGNPAQGNIDITMCGADPSGTDDSTTAIQNAICNAKAAGT